MLVSMFPGQGSQRKGMGENLFDDFLTLTRKASDILGYSIKHLCLEDPQHQLTQTQYTQPALYVVNSLTYIKRFEETGRKPDFVIGHSLGEYAALFAAGGVDFETGLRMVQKRGELMNQEKGGGMAAILGLSRHQVSTILCDENLLKIDIANDNSPSQIVIAGPTDEINKAKKYIEKNNADFITLNVSAAFHSRYMQTAQAEFRKFLSTIVFQSMTIPLISNVQAQPYQPTDIMENLVNQITNPVRWTECISYLLNQDEHIDFEELGPGNTLTKLVKQIKSK